jgi:hypothetical protein
MEGKDIICIKPDIHSATALAIASRVHESLTFVLG